LLDEPLSALDKALRADLQWELKSLHRRLGATFINVTHDQEEALSMSDEIIILREGRVEQSGAPEDLYARPRSQFVASFLGESNFLRGTASGSQNGCLIYKVGDQQFLQQGEGLVSAGHPVLVSLRPENVVAASSRPDTINAVRGQISDFKYVGSSYFLQVNTDIAGSIMVKAAARQSDFDPTSNTPIWIGWQPDASVVVQDK